MTSIPANSAAAPTDTPTEAVTAGVLAEYADVDSLLAAAEQVRDAGYTKWEAYSPFPVHGLDDAMGHKMTILPWLVLGGGLFGLTAGMILVYVTNAVSIDIGLYALRGYDYHISGKPVFSLPANIPPVYELVILFSALTAFFGMLAMNMLPRFNHPVFHAERFAKATHDRFFIMIDANDPAFETARSTQLLQDTSPAAVETVKEPR